jgi:CubicO group peptidase (beta-lactamase class C family)
VDKFAERNLFCPLGITNYTWWAFPNGVFHTGGGLYLRPRDMAKIGCVVLNNGRWHGKQIVSEAWIKESTTKQAPDPGPRQGYGYQWWHFPFKVGDQSITAIQAAGNGNQTILIFPSLDLIVVVTAWDTAKALPFIRLVVQYLLPAALTRATSN